MKISEGLLKYHLTFANLKLVMIFILLSFSLFSCFSTSKWKTEVDFEEIELEKLPTQEDYPDAGAVVLLDEAEIDIFRSRDIHSSQLEKRMIVKIFNKKGYRYANMAIPYSEGTEISNIRARTILPDGRIIPLKDDQIFDVTLYPNFIFYSDIRAKRFTMPAIEDGCIVEYRWTKKTDNFTYWTQWYFQHDEPLKLGRYTLRCLSEWDIKWKTYGIDIQPEFQTLPDGFKAIRKWEVHDMPAFIPETGMPPGSEVIANIMFSPVGITNWDQISGWYYKLAKDRMEPSNEITDLVKTLIKDDETEKEKIKKIYEFVRDNVRYVAIEIGIGGFQPHFAGDVLENRYGDCKDMTTLMVAMGKAADLNINPVLVTTWTRGDIDTSLVSHAHFNHAIAVATLEDSSKIWMDATDKTAPFGKLPWVDQDRLVMEIGKKGKPLFISTPGTSALDNLSKSVWDIKVNEDGSAEGQLTMKFMGSPASNIRWRLHFLHPIPFDIWMGQHLLSKFPKMESTGIKIENQYEYDKPLILKSSFKVPRILTDAGNYYTFNPGGFTSFDWHVIFAEKDRNFNVDIGYPLMDVDDINISYPAKWELASKVGKEDIGCHFAKSKFKINSDKNGQLTYHRSFQIDSTFIDKLVFESFRNFLNNVAYNDQKILLFKDPSRPEKPMIAREKSLEERLQEEIPLLNRPKKLPEMVNKNK